MSHVGVRTEMRVYAVESIGPAWTACTALQTVQAVIFGRTWEDLSEFSASFLLSSELSCFGRSDYRVFAGYTPTSDCSGRNTETSGSAEQ